MNLNSEQSKAVFVDLTQFWPQESELKRVFIENFSMNYDCAK